MLLPDYDKKNLIGLPTSELLVMVLAQVGAMLNHLFRLLRPRRRVQPGGWPPAAGPSSAQRRCSARSLNPY